MRALITGGSGFIGSHLAVELLTSGYEVAIYDDLSNSSSDVLERIKLVAAGNPRFYLGDITSERTLLATIEDFSPDTVFHLAGVKSVPESATDPLQYYKINVCGTRALLSAMRKQKTPRLIFSSSATVYDPSEKSPLVETANCNPTSVYGHTKLTCEKLISSIVAAEHNFEACILRYFNPVGCHPSGLIGEEPLGKPGNLMPAIASVAFGREPVLKIFGNDFPTKDGTGIRDYIHVLDLARAHISALKALRPQRTKIFNVGTGYGFTVQEVIDCYEEKLGNEIPRRYVERRTGDVAVSYSSPEKIKRELSWTALRSLDDMCADSIKWEKSRRLSTGDD